MFDSISHWFSERGELYFPVPLNGDVVRDIDISALEHPGGARGNSVAEHPGGARGNSVAKHLEWARLEVCEIVVWEWVSGQPYTAPPPLNLLAVKNHSCGIRVGLAADACTSCPPEIRVRGVFDLYHDYNVRQRMACVGRDSPTWFMWDDEHRSADVHM